jgi:flavin reductase (DIM6/NTAB) family NADH-FMN oxidoreductase RutF
MNKIIRKNDLLAMEKNYRINLINCLSGYKPLNLVGTQDTKQQTNLAIFNSVFHLGADPALMGCIIRPNSVERHTYENILELKQFTFNHVHQDIFEMAHQTSARYPKEISEFQACSFTEEYIDNFQAPFVKEAHIKIGLDFVRAQDIPENNTILLIGAVQMIIMPEDVFQDDGFLDLEKAATVAGAGLDGYYAPTIVTRLSYAKPDRPLTRF